jgi:hypothetical protein
MIISAKALPFSEFQKINISEEKPVTKFIFYTCLIITFLLNTSLLYAADINKSAEKESIGSAIAGNAQEVKKEFNKTKDETKEAVIRDINEIKKQLPSDVRELKKGVIKQSEDTKNLTIQELKEIRDGLKKSIK